MCSVRGDDTLTVNGDVDLAFVISSVVVHLGTARVLAIVLRRDVRDPQSRRHVLKPTALCNGRPPASQRHALTAQTPITPRPEKSGAALFLPHAVNFNDVDLRAPKS